MADPVTLGVSMGLSAIGGVVSAFGASEKASAESQMYQYKAGIAQMNQKIAEGNAVQEIQIGGSKAQIAGLQGGLALGKMKAQQGASGLDVNTGSPEALRESEHKGIEETQGIIRNDAARAAYGYKVQGANFTAEGQLDTSAATNAEEAGKFAVASSILGGATSVSDKWLSAKRAGVFS